MEELKTIVAAWAERRTIRAFFDEAECSLKLGASTQDEVLAKRLTLARAFVGDIDPLDALATWNVPHELLIGPERASSKSLFRRLSALGVFRKVAAGADASG